MYIMHQTGAGRLGPCKYQLHVTAVAVAVAVDFKAWMEQHRLMVRLSCFMLKTEHTYAVHAATALGLGPNISHGTIASRAA